MRKLIAVLFMGVALTACAGPNVDVESENTDDTSIIVFQYGTVERKCDGPNMVYSVYQGVAVAPNDPRCVGATNG